MKITDKGVLQRLERLEHGGKVDGAVLLMETEDGWKLSGAMSGTFPSVRAAQAYFEKRKQGEDTPLIIIDI